MKKSISNKLSDYFRKKPVLKAYIFGSVIRNEDDEKSDIDILVELDYSQSIGLEFVEMKLDLEEILNRKVDLLSSNAISKYIRPFIDKDKVLIYER
jgi:predicted nucleotidyltransferase